MGNKSKGTAFEYRAKKWLESQPNVAEVIRSGGSLNIDFTVIKHGRTGGFDVSKEEAKSSLSWTKTKVPNPLSLLDADDKGKLAAAQAKGFSIFLIYRKPKISKKGKVCRATDVVRSELKFDEGTVLIE